MKVIFLLTRLQGYEMSGKKYFKGRHYVLTVQRNWLKKVKITYLIIDNAMFLLIFRNRSEKKNILENFYKTLDLIYIVHARQIKSHM